MRLHLTCRSCRTRFFVDVRRAGRKARCPNRDCGKVFRVPIPAKSSSGSSQQPDNSVCAVDRPTRPVNQKSLGRFRRPSLPFATLLGIFALASGVVLFQGLFAVPVPRVTSQGMSLEATPVSSGRLVAAEATPEKAAVDQVFMEVVQPFFTTYCIDCHGDFLAEANLNFESLPTIEELKKNRKQWNHVLGIVRIGAMPPADHDPQPPMKLRNQVVEWLDKTLNYVDCGVVRDPGHVTIRRLNRVEYNHTIRDLIGVKFEPAANFPSDDVGNGFDNQGAVLTLPPLLMEKYLDAAAQITDRAIVSDITTLLIERKGGGSLPSRGDISHEFAFKPGKYLLRAEVEADQAGDEPAKTAFLLAGKEIKTFEVEGEDQPNVFEVAVEIQKEEAPTFGVSFLNDYYNKDAKTDGERDRNLRVNWLEIEGPQGGTPELPESHRRIIKATPKSAGSVREAARVIFEAFVPRAYRRPAEPIEIKRLVNLVEMAVNQGETFEQAVAYGVQAVLVSPHFLFRVEDNFGPTQDGMAELGDYEMASRLSYFLWSTMPDEELFRLAKEQKLSNPEVREEQVRRMLADEKSKALVVNFFGQWLNLRRLDQIEPDPREYPWWNSQLKRAMRTETHLFCAALIREDRPIMDLLNADFTYVNPRLAELYGVKWKEKDPKELYYAYEGGHPADYKGDRRSGQYKHENDFVRVSLPENRQGVLTHASILTLTSNPGYTSPVMRGKWIMENLLGTPPPPPPPGIPSFEDAKKANPNATLREQLALHRSDPSCASCHKVMDPLGLAFEHYNVIGKWRDKDGKIEIDATGELGKGETFDGAIELVEILKTRDEQIVRHFVEKLMTYALGRGLQPYDRCAVDEVIARAAKDDFRFSAIMLAIVESDPFRMSRQTKDSQ